MCDVRESWNWVGLDAVKAHIKSEIPLCVLSTIDRIHLTRWQMHGAKIKGKNIWWSYTIHFVVVFFSIVSSRPAPAAAVYDKTLVNKCQNACLQCGRTECHYSETNCHKKKEHNHNYTWVLDSKLCLCTVMFCGLWATLVCWYSCNYSLWQKNL